MKYLRKNYMYKILIYAHDPGGINATKPLEESLRAAGFEVVSHFKILPENTINNFNPDLIITGTSANDKTEKNIWLKAKNKNIKTLAILDHWVNYGIRFSKYGLLELDKFNKNPDIFPDYIIVPNNFAKEEMIKDGVRAEIIFPLGNPHFEQIKLNAPKCSEKYTDTILFCSEPYIEDYGAGKEKIAASDIYNFCKKNSLKLIIKLHPKEDVSKYKEFEGINVKILKEAALTELMQKCALTISMTSMVLIEGAILHLPILSYQPSETNPDNFILTKQKVLPFINNYIDLCKYLTDIVLNRQPLEYNFDINFDAKEKIANFIRGEICQS